MLFTTIFTISACNSWKQFTLRGPSVEGPFLSLYRFGILVLLVQISDKCRFCGLVMVLWRNHRMRGCQLLLAKVRIPKGRIGIFNFTFDSRGYTTTEFDVTCSIHFLEWCYSVIPGFNHVDSWKGAWPWNIQGSDYKNLKLTALLTTKHPHPGTFVLNCVILMLRSGGLGNYLRYVLSPQDRYHTISYPLKLVTAL